MIDMIYKTETHCHTSEISHCAEESALQCAEKYREAGYTSIVMTNHFKDNYLDGDTWREKIDIFFDATKAARDALTGSGMYILSGMELTLNESNNDYLLFGAKRDFFYDAEGIFEKSASWVARFADERGMIMIHAHPMRFGATLRAPDGVHGIEVFNGSLRQQSRNDVAAQWVREFSGLPLILTSGSDHHKSWEPPTGGICTDFPLTTDDELLSVLRSGNYSLIRSEL